MADLALYTTIHPGAARYVREWYQSVQRQSDKDFDLWIGVNGMTRRAAEQLIPSRPGMRCTWVEGGLDESPAETRQHALSRIVAAHTAVVLVDSDDVLLETRVAAARWLLASSDLAACALGVIDAAGRDLGLTFGSERDSLDDVLPRHNVFGLSNSAYRCNLLARCLAIPRDAILIDWFLATRAWLLGAVLAFDPAPRMRYRQHGDNTARVVPPFSCRQVEEDTARVLAHFRLLLREPSPDCLHRRLKDVRAALTDVERFRSRVVQNRQALADYVGRLNALQLPGRWWCWVAHPGLADMWT